MGGHWQALWRRNKRTFTMARRRCAVRARANAAEAVVTLAISIREQINYARGRVPRLGFDDP